MTSADKETTPMMEEVTEDEYSDRFDEEEGELPTHGQQGDNVYRSGKKTHRQQGDNAYTSGKEEPTNRRGFNVYRSGKNPPTDGGGGPMSKDQLKLKNPPTARGGGYNVYREPSHSRGTNV